MSDYNPRAIVKLGKKLPQVTCSNLGYWNRYFDPERYKLTFGRDELAHISQYLSELQDAGNVLLMLAGAKKVEDFWELASEYRVAVFRIVTLLNAWFKRYGVSFDVDTVGNQLAMKSNTTRSSNDGIDDALACCGFISFLACLCPLFWPVAPVAALTTATVAAACACDNSVSTYNNSEADFVKTRLIELAKQFTGYIRAGATKDIISAIVPELVDFIYGYGTSRGEPIILTDQLLRKPILLGAGQSGGYRVPVVARTVHTTGSRPVHTTSSRPGYTRVRRKKTGSSTRIRNI